MEDGALSENWCRQLRLRWREDLLRATSASQMRNLLSELEQHVRWGHFDSFLGDGESPPDMADEQFGVGGSAQRRGPGRPPKRGRALPNNKSKRSRTSSCEDVTHEADSLVAEDLQVPLPRVSSMDVSEDSNLQGAQRAAAPPLSGKDAAGEDDADAMEDEERRERKEDVEEGEGDEDDEGEEDEGEEEDEEDEGETLQQHKDEKVARRTRHALMQENMLQRALTSVPTTRRDEDSDENEEEATQPTTHEEVSTVDGFQQLAATFKSNFFGNSIKGGKRASKPGILATDIEVPPDRIELDFWRLVGGGEKAERARDYDVCYSAVALSRGAGGGFAHADEPGAAREEPYLSSPWNLHNLPRQSDCVLSHMADDALAMVPTPLPTLHSHNDTCTHNI